MAAYKTIAARAEAEIVEKKSHFIGRIAPVATEEEALAFIAEVKAAHRMARHNVYAYVLREGSDVTIVANGVEIREALAAADALAADGISAEVIDAFSVKPLDGATILESVAKTRCVVTAEEHSVIGGLGSAVCELLAGADPVCVECVAVRDRFGKSGEFEELLGYFNIDATAIVEAVKKVRERAGLC